MVMSEHKGNLNPVTFIRAAEVPELQLNEHQTSAPLPQYTLRMKKYVRVLDQQCLVLVSLHIKIR